MKLDMLRLRHHLKILDTIIERIAINVMDHFILSKHPT